MMNTKVNCFSPLLVVSLVWGCGTAAPTTAEGGDESKTAPTTAEILAENAAADEAAGLVFTLDVGDRHQIQFFSPGGVLLVSERAPMGVKLVSQEAADPSPAGLFHAVRPGEALPDVLKAFETLEADVAMKSADGVVGDDAGGEILAPSAFVEKHATSSGAHFRDGHLMCPSALRDVIRSYPAFARGCWLNVGGYGATWNNATHSQVFVGSYDGNNSLQFFYDGVWKRTTTVLQGENQTIFAWSGKSGDNFVSKQHRYDIDGAGRHVGVAYVKAPTARGPLSATVVW